MVYTVAIYHGIYIIHQSIYSFSVLSIFRGTLVYTWYIHWYITPLYLCLMVYLIIYIFFCSMEWTMVHTIMQQWLIHITLRYSDLYDCLDYMQTAFKLHLLHPTTLTCYSSSGLSGLDAQPLEHDVQKLEIVDSWSQFKLEAWVTVPSLTVTARPGGPVSPLAGP